MNEDRRRRRWGALFLRTLLAALLMVPLTMGTVSALAWHTETADATGDVGWYSSLTLDDAGNPRISYLNRSNYHLKYARLDGSGWHNETVDATGYVGYYSSLVLDNAGNPRISYLDGSNFNPKYARLDGLGWQTETADVTGYGGEYSSLALDNAGNPRISYLDGSNSDLKYAWRDSKGWHTETVDGAGLVGWFSSLALDDAGNPRIGYLNISNSDLKYAWKDGEGWHNETADTTGDVGYYSSLALDDEGNPRISYYDLTNVDLKYAWKDGEGWHNETADTAGEVGEFSSLALDDEGNPRIGYYDGSPNYDLKYAWKDGEGWHNETADAAGHVGWFSSLALDDAGNPRIGYYDETNSDLKYAWADLPQPPTPSGPSPSFAAYPQSGPAPHTVQFLDYTPNAQSWRWDFGDGGSSTLQYPTHVYTATGLYTVSLIVTDWAGATSTKTEYHYIRVTDPVTPAPTPVANFTANATVGQAPLAVQFMDASSLAPYHWWWTFGDGSLSTDANPVHTYSQAGSYTVNLTTWTTIGTVSTSKSAYVTVGPDSRAPLANFTMSRSSGTAPLYVKFTDASTNAASWRWSFGGLAWTTATNPSVIFHQPGEYAVTLTATNAYGSSTAIRNLSVTGAMPRSVRGSAVSVVG